MKRAALQGRETFGDQLGAAVDQPRLLGAILQRTARNLVVVRLVRLAEIGGVSVRDRALARIQCSAALVSSPPENAMPTFWPTGTFSRMLPIDSPVHHHTSS